MSGERQNCRQKRAQKVLSGLCTIDCAVVMMIYLREDGNMTGKNKPNELRCEGREIVWC